MPSLICPDPVDVNGNYRTYGGLYKTKIGLITSDEMNMAGLSLSYEVSTNENNYLYRRYSLWSISPAKLDYQPTVSSDKGGYFDLENVSFSNNAIPVINLKSDVTFTGTGTDIDPYIIQ